MRAFFSIEAGCSIPLRNDHWHPIDVPGAVPVNRTEPLIGVGRNAEAPTAGVHHDLAASLAGLLDRGLELRLFSAQLVVSVARQWQAPPRGTATPSERHIS